MLKKLFSMAALMLITSASFAAVDVNKATQAELEAVKGIGPSITTKILDERKKGSFKDWNNLIERVPGVGDANAAKFSAEGVTVNGAAFAGAPAKSVAAAAPDKASKLTTTKAEDKKSAATAPAMAAAPVAAAPLTVSADGTKASKAEAKKAAKEAKAAAAASAPASSAKK